MMIKADFESKSIALTKIIEEVTQIKQTLEADGQPSELSVEQKATMDEIVAKQALLLELETTQKGLDDFLNLKREEL